MADRTLTPVSPLGERFVIEAGDTRPSGDLLVGLAQKLHVTLAYFFETDGQQTRPVFHYLRQHNPLAQPCANHHKSESVVEKRGF